MKNNRSVTVSAVVALAVVCCLHFPGSLGAQPRLTEAQAAALPQVAPNLLPRVGTYWSLTFPTNPPLPLLINSNLPVYRLPDNSFLVDDTSVPIRRKGPAVSPAVAARNFLTEAGLTSQQPLAYSMLTQESPTPPPGETNAPPQQTNSPPQLLPPGTAPTNGTFWFVTKTNCPPLPFNPVSGADVYLLSDGTYLVDDSSYYWPPPSGGGGGSDGPFGIPYSSGDLWIEIRSASRTQASLVLHGTSPGTNYTRGIIK